jgi:hypothetical protein
VRVGVVDAVHRDLLDVGAEQLPREPLRILLRQRVGLGDLLAVDPLEHEHALGHVWVDHLGHDEVLVLGHEPRDQLRAVRLLDEVELVAEMRLELLGQRLELEEPGRLRPSLCERRE